MPKPVPKATQKSSQKAIPKTEPKKQRQGDRKKKAKAGRKPHRETCADSEHDFLTLWMRLVNDFIDHGSHEHIGKDKNTPEDSKSLERKTHDFNIQNFASAKEALHKQTTGPKSTIERQPTTSHKPGVVKKAKAEKVVVQRLSESEIQALQSSQGSMHGSSARSTQDSSSEKS